jgi:hypothetical protein
VSRHKIEMGRRNKKTVRILYDPGRFLSAASGTGPHRTASVVAQVYGRAFLFMAWVCAWGYAWACGKAWEFARG